MSVFDDVPDPNPFDADIATRPATFVLRPERADRYIIGFIALFWLVFGPVLTGLVVASLLLLFDLTDYLRPVLIVSAAVAFVVYVWWWWAEFVATFRVVNVTIADASVDVHERDLFRNRTWSQPLSAFQGVALVSLGTRLVGFSKKPMAAVMLVHPDPSRSIPLSIASTNRLGRQNVGQKARQLGLPALPGVAAGKTGKVYPADAIVVNRYQALKMRLIQAGFALAPAVLRIWCDPPIWHGRCRSRLASDGCHSCPGPHRDAGVRAAICVRSQGGWRHDRAADRSLAVAVAAFSTREHPRT